MLPILIVTLIAVNTLALTKLDATDQKLVEQRITTVETKDRLNTTSTKLEAIQVEKQTVDTSLREERQKSETLQKENESLKAKSQAKKDAEEQARLASEQAGKASIVASPAVLVSGDKATWLAQSGIPESEWGLVDWLVSRESGWNPCAYNPGLSDCTTDFVPSSACGLVQTLPCGKYGSNWRDPVAALRWQYNYVCTTPKFAVYGPCYAGAVGYWKVHGNY